MRNCPLILHIILSLAILSVCFGQNLTIYPLRSTTPTTGSADDPAIWIHPTNPERSVIVGIDKESGIYVWDTAGNLLQQLPQGTSTNNIDVRYGFKFGNEIVDIVAANLRSSGKLAVFKVNLDYDGANVLVQLAGKNDTENNIQKDSYGFCLYRRPSDGTLFAFDRPKDGGEIRQYRIDDNGTGNGIRVTAVRTLEYNGGTAEGFVADDELGFIYISEEGEGIHKYYADPDKGNNGAIASFATDDGISGDREGLCLYKCSDGTGYLILSSQGNSTLKIYRRQDDNRLVKTVEAADDLGHADLGTDGLDITSFAAPPLFPNGFMVVHDESNSRYHIYDWAQAAEDDLTICVNGDSPTFIDQERKGGSPETFILEQNYPNPFNAQTAIPYNLLKAGKVTLAVYDLSGKLTNILVNETQAAGEYVINWDGRDYDGLIATSGLYLAQMTLGDHVRSIKLLFIR